MRCAFLFVAAMLLATPAAADEPSEQPKSDSI